VCVFCDIAQGRSDSEIVLDEESCIAFLDARPLQPGHSLLIPREHHETLADLPAELLPPLFAAAQRLAVAVEEGMGAQGTFVAINNKVSQSVPHLHVHVVPRRPKDGLRGFFWPRRRYAEGEAREVAARIREAVAARGAA
jgi:histidine triad (HIT) family protein